MIKLQLTTAVCICAAFISFNTNAATVQLAPFPAPGGTSYIGTGGAGTSGGLTWSFSNFDDTYYDQLYYVVGDYPSGFFDPSGPSVGVGAQDILSYSNYTTSTVTWTGSTTFDVYSGVTPIASTYDARFTLSILGATSLADASTIAGMPLEVGAAYEVTGDFQANWLFEIDLGGGNWVAANDAFDSLNTVEGDIFETHAGGAFYYTSPVPVPAAVWLFGSGLIGLVGLARRKKV